VQAANGRYYVQKALDACGDANLLFNEAFGSRLGAELGLSFPDWVELLGHEDDLIEPTRRARYSRIALFGSELVSGDLIECMPGGWLSGVQNRLEAYLVLLFDLWCNHTDDRQIVYRSQGHRSSLAYFIDHDQLFGAEERQSDQQRIAQARHLDRRLYDEPPHSLEGELAYFASKIITLVSCDLESIVAEIPGHWGSAAHRRDVVCALNRRSCLLPSYIDEILKFAEKAASAGAERF
jgi:hypothetical protein